MKTKISYKIINKTLNYVYTTATNLQTAKLIYEHQKLLKKYRYTIEIDFEPEEKPLWNKTDNTFLRNRIKQTKKEIKEYNNQLTK